MTEIKEKEYELDGKTLKTKLIKVIRSYLYKSLKIIIPYSNSGI